MPWHVTLTGADTGTEYVIRVDAPADAHVPAVYISAAAEYNALVLTGKITESYSMPMGAEYIDDKED